MIKFDFETYNHIKLDNYDLSNIIERFKRDNNKTGWYYINHDTQLIKKYAYEIRNNADIFLIIGIGGSSIGAQAVISALSPYYNNSKPEIIFVGETLSSDYIVDLIDHIEGKSVYLNVISKSGNTLETLITFDIFLNYLKNNFLDYKKRVFVTTNDTDGELLNISKKEGFRNMVVPDNIGGRFSVLSCVGLLPIAVANIDIDKILTGSEKAKENLEQIFKYTIIRNKMFESNKIVESFDIYEPKLFMFTEWIKQIFAESQGKENKGILPISTTNTRDLHSLGQFYQEGSQIMFSTTIFAHSKQNLYIEKYNKSLNQINKIVMNSVAEAHFEKFNTNIIELDAINEENVGYLILFFEISSMLGSYLLGVNYFDEPGVIKYKNIINCKLNN